MRPIRSTACLAALTIGTLMATAGCGAKSDAPPGASGPAATPPGSTVSTGLAYRMPANVCDAVSPATAARAQLTYESKRTDPIYVPGPQGEPVSSSISSCTWTFPNPAHGGNGRPNQWTATVQYAVIEPKLGNAAELAHTVVFENGIGTRDEKDVTVVRADPAPVPVDEGYYVYLTQKTVTGADSAVEVVLRRANAVVMVRFSGADLTKDPTLPAGLQLVTTPVDEARLRPTLDLILPEALALIR